MNSEYFKSIVCNLGEIWTSHNILLFMIDQYHFRGDSIEESNYVTAKDHP
jgi:hypothetical protein